MLTAEKIGKKFSGITALCDVSMELLPGKVTAIIGENGAGKSTLMKILSGVYPEYDGKIIYKGEEVRFENPREAQACGIAIIHQELNLIPDLSITENIFLGRELENAWGFLDKNGMHQKTQELLERLKLDVKPNTLIRDLKLGQQQVVEIAKALLTDSEVIIMDEPTSAISDHEVEILFGIIENLRKENKAIVYISHKLDELFKIADSYIVLRDGKVTETGTMDGVNHDLIIKKMVGRDIKIIEKGNRITKSENLLNVENLTLVKKDGSNRVLLDNLNFSLKSGEILGIFGLMGAGRTELLECILGMHPSACLSSVSIENKKVKLKSPREAIQSGIVLVPEDRKRDGLVLGLDVKTNITLSTLNEIQKAGLLSKSKELALTDKYIDSLQIKTSSPHQAVKNLSGGNQQKVVLARCLATQPKVLMLDEPTRGVDAGAKNEIYKLIMELSEAGLGIIVVSSELPEILTVSDRVLVMAEGKITAEFSSANANEDAILKAAIPQTI
ncbi:monosaccharide ABC transporter ATP-binding protein, CUT2 family [Flavobacterium fluvii]|uniref:Monosaccharide ABC transporter ATP-binding protein, CUT2 family n=1 Tax=Flavobacterium fluvii TaxID=468056 RepID=A0A1M5F765_9FLAO|nr:sugar ABC transporter ATP-binding protein [Flavobacterium fluvii]SHF86891.1 monosaccharide ABC transporter ATP-binding protein, CUT2 family [Flavobacterium fluvii]